MKIILPETNKLIFVVIILIVAIGGVITLRATSAATPAISVEAEDGTMLSPAVVLADTTASGQKAIKFQAGLWMPTADRPLALHWVLDGPLNLNDPIAMGLRDFSGAVLPEPDVYDIDGEMNTATTVKTLHDKGKKVICYFDAGVYETYRTDAYKFQALSPQIWGNADQGWAGSYWLDVRRVEELRPIMDK